MISLKVLSAAATMALVAIPVASFAQSPGGGPVIPRLGGGVGGGPAPIVYGNNSAANVRIGAGAPGARVGGGVVSGPRIGGGGYQGGYTGGGYYRGGGGGGYYRHRYSGAAPFIAGALVGGAIASQSYGYYGDPAYYDDGYYDGGAVAVEAAPVGGDSVEYCRQTYRSYDPRSGTYLGYDGQRHPCP